MEFNNSIEFFNYCQELYLEILEKQYPDMEQGLFSELTLAAFKLFNSR